MSKKFIPNGDLDFLTKAECFAKHLAANPARFEIAEGDAVALSEAVAKFRKALNDARFGGKSEAATRAKNDARAEAVKIMRRLGHLVRSNIRIDAATKISLGIQPRQEKPKMLTVPNEAPRLRFLRALHEGGATPQHELKFYSIDKHWISKPPGAVRLELFVDLIPPDEPIPSHPGANHASRPWYLRSYTRSPIRLTPPMARVPMRVVYWGRWADSVGNVGPFSATAVAWIEGGTHGFLPGGAAMHIGRPPVKMIEDATEPRADRDASYTIAALEMRYGTMATPPMPEALPAPEPREQRQLEASDETEAA